MYSTKYSSGPRTFDLDCRHDPSLPHGSPGPADTSSIQLAVSILLHRPSVTVIMGNSSKSSACTTPMYVSSPGLMSAHKTFASSPCGAIMAMASNSDNHPSVLAGLFLFCPFLSITFLFHPPCHQAYEASITAHVGGLVRN